MQNRFPAVNCSVGAHCSCQASQLSLPVDRQQQHLRSRPSRPSLLKLQSPPRPQAGSSSCGRATTAPAPAAAAAPAKPAEAAKPAAAPATAKTTLTIWTNSDTWTKIGGYWTEQTAQKFPGGNVTINAVMIPYADFEAKYLAAFSAGSGAPDLFQGQVANYAGALEVAEAFPKEISDRFREGRSQADQPVPQVQGRLARDAAER